MVQKSPFLVSFVNCQFEETAANEIICTLHDPNIYELAADMNTTRSAAALELWRPRLAGSVVAIGNAPTALFHLLNMLEDPACPRPAAIIG